MKRRTFLTASAALAALPLRADDRPPDDRLFIVVIADGGWDPTRVMQPAFNIADMEPDAAPATLGDLTFVDHPERPQVRWFLEQHRERTIFLNGLRIPSVSHGVCRGMLLTGTRSAAEADWTTRLARAHADRVPLPHLVLSGPAFAGDSPLAVARVGRRRQLAELLGDDALDDLALTQLGDGSRGLIEARLAREPTPERGQQALALDQAAREALARLRDLRGRANLPALLELDALQDPWSWAVTALSIGACRCVTLTWPNTGVLRWDSHGGNDELQSSLFEDLFHRLSALLTQLAATGDASGTPLSRRVTVVVVSEMGRSPLLNTVAGKDHWPYTSAMLIGAGVAGGRSFGGIDQSFRGLGVDLTSGGLSSSAEPLTPETLGATLLALGGLDPLDELGVEPLWPALA